MKVTREELYQEVWTEPMQKVAARLGISDVYLARVVCRRLRVPHPKRGYWAQLAAGLSPPRPPLPPPRSGDELEWCRGGGTVRRVPPDLPKPPARRNRPIPKARAVRTASHPLLVGVAELFKEGRLTYGGGYYKPRKRRLPDLLVSPDTLERALELLNGLYLSLEDRGYPVVIGPRDRDYNRPPLDPREPPRPKQEFWDGWSPCDGTISFLGTVAVGLTLYEITERAKVAYVRGKKVRVSDVPRRSSVGWVQTEDIPSGRLALRAYSPYRGAPWELKWVEKKPGDLAGMLEAVCKALEVAAPDIARLAADAEHQAAIDLRRREAEWREYQRREEERRREHERREQERRRNEAVTKSRDAFLSIVEEWASACRIEAFVQDMTRRLSDLTPPESALMAERLERARHLLGSTSALERFRGWSTPEELLASGR